MLVKVLLIYIAISLLIGIIKIIHASLTSRDGEMAYKITFIDVIFFPCLFLIILCYVLYLTKYE